MTIRSTSGMLVSVCQTVSGGRPAIFVSAAIMSRSRLSPGSRTTADFIADLFQMPFRPCTDPEQLLLHRTAGDAPQAAPSVERRPDANAPARPQIAAARESNRSASVREGD